MPWRISPGSFVYNPASGKVLNAGNGQVLAVAFTPTDASNYTNASATVAINVAKAKLTVAADNKSRAYGVVNPEFTGTITGVTNGDKITPAYSCSATIASPTGNYSIIPSLSDPDGKLDNYIAALNNGILTVQKATGSVTLTNLTQIYDGTPKAISATTSPTGLTVAIAYDGKTNAPVAAGTYAVTAAVNDTNYQATAQVSLVIQKATPSVTWANPTDIVYGTPLGAGQMNAMANIPGSFVYNPASGNVLNAGNGQALAVAFTPTDASNYTNASATVAINVAKAKLTVAADNKSRAYGAINPDYTGTITGITNGDKIAPAYSCSATTASPVGNYSIIPSLSDPDGKLDNYIAALNNGILTVQKATGSVTLTNLTQIYDGTPKAVSATTSPTGLTVAIAYDGKTNAPVAAGTYAVTATVNDTNYQATAQGSLVIQKATPLVTWANPTDIGYGTPLGAGQLNATANIPGSFVYNPASGIVLNAGNGQVLEVAFTPTDASNYTNTSATVAIKCCESETDCYRGQQEPRLWISQSNIYWNDRRSAEWG